MKAGLEATGSSELVGMRSEVVNLRTSCWVVWHGEMFPVHFSSAFSPSQASHIVIFPSVYFPRKWLFVFGIS